MTILNPWRPGHCLFLNSSERLKSVVLAKHHWCLIWITSAFKIGNIPSLQCQCRARTQQMHKAATEARMKWKWLLLHSRQLNSSIQFSFLKTSETVIQPFILISCTNWTSKRMLPPALIYSPAMTCRPLPLPSLAPSIIPGRSSSYLFRGRKVTREKNTFLHGENKSYFYLSSKPADSTANLNRILQNHFPFDSYILSHMFYWYNGTDHLIENMRTTTGTSQSKKQSRVKLVPHGNASNVFSSTFTCHF